MCGLRSADDITSRGDQWENRRWRLAAGVLRRQQLAGRSRRAAWLAGRDEKPLDAGAGCGLACDLVSLAVALPRFTARRIQVPLAGHGDLAVLAAVIVPAAIFAAAGAGLAALS